MNGHKAYSIYRAVGLHFTQEKYDAFKYNFKANIKSATFEKRNDRYIFDKIARRYPNENDLKLFFVDNIMSDNVWVGDMSDEVYEKRNAHRQALSYNYEKEIKIIREEAYKYNLDFDGVCKPNSNKTDNILLNLYMSQKVSADTIAIIDHFVSFIKSLKNELNDPLEIAQSNLLILSKYQKFIIPLLGANEYKYRYKLILLFTSRPNQYNMEFVGINNTPQYK